MSSKFQSSARGVLALVLFAGLGVGAGRAGATELVDVRVGRHPEFTRVVLETDGPAKHRLDRSEPGAIRVEVSARASARRLAPSWRSPLSEVTVDPRTADASEVRLGVRGDVEVRTTILRGPDRIVLDLYAAGTQPALTKSSAQAPREPSPKVPVERTEPVVEAAAEPSEPRARTPREPSERLARTPSEPVRSAAPSVPPRTLQAPAAEKAGALETPSPVEKTPAPREEIAAAQEDTAVENFEPSVPATDAPLHRAVKPGPTGTPPREGLRAAAERLEAGQGQPEPTAGAEREILAAADRSEKPEVAPKPREGAFRAGQRPAGRPPATVTRKPKVAEEARAPSAPAPSADWRSLLGRPAVLGGLLALLGIAIVFAMRRGRAAEASQAPETEPRSEEIVWAEPEEGEESELRAESGFEASAPEHGGLPVWAEAAETEERVPRQAEAPAEEAASLAPEEAAPPERERETELSALRAAAPQEEEAEEAEFPALRAAAPEAGSEEEPDFPALRTSPLPSADEPEPDFPALRGVAAPEAEPEEPEFPALRGAGPVAEPEKEEEEEPEFPALREPPGGGGSDDAVARGASVSRATGTASATSTTTAGAAGATRETGLGETGAMERNSTMDQGMTTSTDFGAPLRGAAGAAGMDVARLIQELDRRVSYLETRLEEVVNAKERLERQVAAQTEELRVQRAAIARTQRVLRGMVRPEEEAGQAAT